MRLAAGLERVVGEARRPMSAVAIAPTRRLLIDGTGPLFAPSPRGALWEAVEAAILALEDARAQTP